MGISKKISIAIILILMAQDVSAAEDRVQDLQCLAKNIYFEGRNQPWVGQLAIAQVTLNESILGRANRFGIVNYHYYNLYDFADPPHHSIDDSPFGGGVGMILKPEPIFRIIDKIFDKNSDRNKFRVLFPTPDGEIFNQQTAKELSLEENLIFISGDRKSVV